MDEKTSYWMQGYLRALNLVKASVVTFREKSLDAESFDKVFTEISALEKSAFSEAPTIVERNPKHICQDGAAHSANDDGKTY